MRNATISTNAADLLKIAIALGGFDAAELRQRMMRARHQIQVRHVEQWLEEMRNEN